MELKTTLHIKESRHKLSHSSSVITLGSCFSEVIGEQLCNNKFTVSANPFGTLFNPLSIAYLLNCCVTKSPLPEHAYIQTRGAWFNYYLHSSLYGNSRQELEKKFTHITRDVYNRLLSCDFLILTLGTAYVYELNGHHHTVSNCHKQPSALFTKRLLSPEEIIEPVKQSLQSLRDINPGLKVIITVSPVRHTKDSIPLNSVSKATLRLVCHQLVSLLPAVEYFPSFEILMDDLRDYRFYKEDMIHPNSLAEKYIWDKFIHCYCPEETLELLNQWLHIKKSLSHKPFNTRSEEHQKFLRKLLEQLSYLNQHISCQEEITLVKSQLQV